jgi:hypothetical protein
MNREEAIQVWKELIIEVKTIPSISIAIMPPKKEDIFSSGYQIHLPLFWGHLDIAPVRKVAIYHELAWMQLSDEIIVYKSTGLSSLKENFGNQKAEQTL